MSEAAMDFAGAGMAPAEYAGFAAAPSSRARSAISSSCTTSSSTGCSPPRSPPTSSPTATRHVAAAQSFAIYGVGFFMRPVGAIVIGAYGDRHGRKNALVVTVGLMAAATALTGLIPSYGSIGIAAPAPAAAVPAGAGLLDRRRMGRRGDLPRRVLAARQARPDRQRAAVQRRPGPDRRHPDRRRC